MFSTELSTFLLVLCLLLVAFSLSVFYWIKALAVKVSAAIEYLHTQNKRALSLRRIAELEATLTELSDSYETLLRSVKKLGARSRARARRANGSDSVDLGASPPSDEAKRAEYKAQLREELRQKGRL